MNNIFYQSVDGDASQKEFIEKMGRATDYTIEKKSFWFRPHAKTFLEMCSRKESLDIAIWTTSLKQNTTRVMKKLVSETLQAKFLFTWTASDCKQQKGKNAIDNSTQVIYKKHLKKVWRMYSQYDATNTILVDCSMETKKENPKENVIIAPSFDGKNEDKWLIADLWSLLNKFYKAPDVRDILKNLQ